MVKDIQVYTRIYKIIKDSQRHTQQPPETPKDLKMLCKIQNYLGQPRFLSGQTPFS